MDISAEKETLSPDWHRSASRRISAEHLRSFCLRLPALLLHRSLFTPSTTSKARSLQVQRQRWVSDLNSATATISSRFCSRLVSSSGLLGIGGLFSSPTRPLS